jgi:hypothetical protein
MIEACEATALRAACAVAAAQRPSAWGARAGRGARASALAGELASGVRALAREASEAARAAASELAALGALSEELRGAVRARDAECAAARAAGEREAARLRGEHGEQLRRVHQESAVEVRALSPPAGESKTKVDQWPLPARAAECRAARLAGPGGCTRPGARAQLSGARDSWRAPTSWPTRRAPRPRPTSRCSPQPEPPPRPARPRPDAAGGRRSARRRQRAPSSSAGRSRRPSAAACGRGHRAWSARSRPSARARRCAAAPSARARRPGRAANAGLGPGHVWSSCGAVRARAERGGGAGAGGGARAGGEARAGRGGAAGAARASYGARARADRAQRHLTSVERAAPLTAARVCARERVASARGGKKRKKRISI